MRPSMETASLDRAAFEQVVQLIAKKDGSAIGMGLQAGWPAELRVALKLALGSQYPTAVLWGQELRILYNDAYAALDWAQPGKAMGEPAKTAWAPFFSELESSLAACLAGRASQVERLRIGFKQDGRKSASCYTFSLTPIADDAGQILGIFCVIVETTQVLKDEVRALAFETSAVGMAEAELETGRIVSANQRFCELVGYSQAELFCMPSLELTLPEDRDRSLAGFTAVVRGELSEFRHEKRYVRKDGSIVWAEVTINLIPGPDSQPVAIMAIAQDISQRKQAEEELRQSEERFRELIELAPDGIFVSSADGWYQDANTIGLQMVGFTRDELRQKTIADLTAEQEVWRVPGEMTRIASGSVIAMVGGMKRKDGSTFVCEVHARQLPDGRIQSFVRDITERRRAEQALADANAQLSAELDVMVRLHTIAMHSMSEPDNISGLLEEMVEAAVEITGADGGSIRLLNRESGKFRLAAYRGLEKPIPDPAVSWAATVARGERLVAEDITAHPFLRGQKALELLLGSGMRALQSTPLATRSGIIVGMLSTYYREAHRPTDRDLRFLDLLARQCADLIEHTEQKRVIDALREAERIKNEFLLTVADPVVIINEFSRIEYANRQAHAVFGYAEGELVGQPHQILIPERFLAVHVPRVEQFLRSPTARMMLQDAGQSIFGRRKDGSEFPIEVSLNSLQILGRAMVSTVIRDVSEPRRLAALAKTNADRLASAIDFIPDPFVMSGKEGHVLLCNSAFQKLLGELLPGSPIGKPCRELWAQALPCLSFGSDEARNRFIADRSAAVKKQGAESYDVHFKDGRVYRFNSRITPDGEVIGLAFDLTENLRHEKELEFARHEAVAASQAKTEFLASMSHELRTPLNAVLGFAQLLQYDKQEALSERQLHMVQGIMRGGEHLLRLIDEVLDLARIEAKGICISAEPVDVAEVLREVLDTLQPAADKVDIRLCHSGMEQGLPMVKADRHRYSQILLNLGSNAIKYNRPGGSVTFSVTEEPARIRVAVIDTGNGIPAEEQAELFQPFHRGGQESGPIPGTGIGLAISKKLTDMMGGSIGFHSQPGGGSEFWIALPVHPSGQRADQRARQRAGHLPLPNAVSHGTVLYVEDNPANVEFMQAAVSAMDGIELLTASTAEAGLEIARLRRPHLILMDINLPGMTGLAACRVLREIQETAGIPIVAISAAAAKTDRLEGEEAGFARYLTKPIRLDELEHIFMAFLPKSIEHWPRPAGTVSGVASAAAAESLPRPPASILLVEDNTDLRLTMEMLLADEGYAVLGIGHPLKALQSAAELKEPLDLLITDLILPSMQGNELADKLRATQPNLEVIFISGVSQAPPDLRGHFFTKPFDVTALLSFIKNTLTARHRRF